VGKSPGLKQLHASKFNKLDGMGENVWRDWAQWCKPVIPTQGKLRQEDCEFEVSLGYIVRPVSKKERKKKTFQDL
jgi:hypothetical protein